MKELEIRCIKETELEDIKIELEDSVYNALFASNHILKNIYSLEELYDQFYESYIAFKSEMFNLNIRNITHFRHDYIRNHEIRSALNRLAFNVLNFGKLYLDRHIYGENKKSFVLEITNSDLLHNESVDFRKNIFNTDKGYILGCVLRNYSQHRQLPVNTMKNGLEYNGSKENHTSRFSITLDPIKLESYISKKEGKAVKDAMKGYFNASTNSVTDLHHVLDRYVHAIGLFHLKNRELTKEVISNSKSLILDISSKINSEVNPCDGIVRIMDLNKNNELFCLSLDWFDVVGYLQNKNHSAVDFNNYDFNQYSSQKVYDKQLL